MLLACDRNGGLVEMPFIAELAARTLTDLVGEGPAEFLCPQPGHLMRNDDPTRRQQVLDHSQTKRKPEIQPHRIGGDFGGKTMAAIKRISVSHGRASHIKIHASLG